MPVRRRQQDVAERALAAVDRQVGPNVSRAIPLGEMPLEDDAPPLLVDERQQLDQAGQRLPILGVKIHRVMRARTETATQTLHRLTSMEAGREWDEPVDDPCLARDYARSRGSTSGAPSRFPAWRSPAAIRQVRTRVSATTMLTPREAE